MDRATKPPLTWKSLPRWQKALLVGAALIYTAPASVILGIVAYDAVFRDAHRLAQRVESLSPDGSRRFVAETDGALRVEDVRTGATLRTSSIQPVQFIAVFPHWQDRDTLTVETRLRRPAKMNAFDYRWDLRTGVFQRPWD